MSFLSQFTNYDFPLFGYVRLPEIKLTEEEKQRFDAPKDCSNTEFLRVLARRGFKTRPMTKDRHLYIARVKQELALFEKLGFIDYVLLVWKITHYCDTNNIARDYGRGSAAGSLIFYLLEITNVEPLKYDLFFERFVSEARAKLKTIDGVTYVDGSLAPDVDIDIEQNKREDVIAHLKSLYPSRVSKIATLTTLSGKKLIKECGKVIAEYEESDMKLVADAIPKKHGVVVDIEVAYKESDAFKVWCDKNPRIYQAALSLEDIIYNRGSHPSGYVVSYDPISDFLPLELNVNKETGVKELITSLTMDYVSYLTIKLDLLGVRCCSVVADVLKATGVKIEDVNIDNDPLIYDQFQNLRTPHGIFQIEASTNLGVCHKVKPKNLSELSDVVAIGRPGALSFLDTYVKNDAEPLHPLFEPILASTRRVCLYQEQMMQLAHAIGFTLEEAEQLRRIVGKKKKEEVAVWEQRIADKIKENNLPSNLGSDLWKILNDSASYSFNKSHSIAYAALGALTTYLKFKYPLEFYCSLLNQSRNEPKPMEEVTKIQSELHYFGIKLLPPHLIKSKMDFSIEGANIRYGLSSIKGVSAKTIEKIRAFQSEYSNKFEMLEGANNAELNIGTLCALIQSGCLSEQDSRQSRPSLTYEAQLWNILTPKEKTFCLEHGKQNNYILVATLQKIEGMTDVKGKPLIKPSRFETIRKKCVPYKEIFIKNKENLALANFFYERMLLGYSYSSNLMEIFKNHGDLISIQSVIDSPTDDRVEFVGIVSDKPFEGRASKGKQLPYGKWIVSDETGKIPCLLFNYENRKHEIVDNLARNRALNHDRSPQKESIVWCTGVKKTDAVFLETILIQDDKIYTKFKDLERDRKTSTTEPAAAEPEK